jgi:hypothetical protein
MSNDVTAADPLEESRARDSDVLSNDGDRDLLSELGFDPLAELVAEERWSSHESG